MIKSRAKHVSLSATPIHRFTYNNTYLESPQKIAEALGSFFASSRKVHSNIPNSCPPCLIWETPSTVSFLPKELATLVGKKQKSATTLDQTHNLRLSSN